MVHVISEFTSSRDHHRLRPPAMTVTKLKLFALNKQLEMSANAQRDGRPAEYSWRPLFNAAKFG